MIIQMWVTRRGSSDVMQDDGKLLMKIVQDPLKDGDKKSKLIMIVCKVWLGWEAKLCKFWEGQSGLQEGKAGMLCAFSRTNS